MASCYPYFVILLCLDTPFDLNIFIYAFFFFTGTFIFAFLNIFEKADFPTELLFKNDVFITIFFKPRQFANDCEPIILTFLPITTVFIEVHP